MRFDWRMSLDVTGVAGGVMAIANVTEITAILGLICSVICAAAAITRFIAKIIITVQKWHKGHITAEKAAEELTDAAKNLESEVKQNGKRD